MNANKYLFEDAPVPKAVATMAIPTMISMLVVVIYNMADTFFIGQTGDPMKVAAVSLANPVFMVLMALGNLFGIGGSSAISRALGEKHTERARHISAFCCYGSLGLGVLMALLFLVVMDGLVTLIGASANTFAYTKEYLSYVAIGAPFVLFGTAFGNILRGEGAARQSMIGNLLGTIVNIILDPIMILNMDMGVAGAAIATVIGNMAASAYYVSHFLRKKSSLSIALKDFQVGNRIASSVTAIGIPASANNILMSCAQIILNQSLAAYGDTPVAAMGVALKSNMIVILLQIGLCVGIQPLIGYNYGARNKKRLLAIFRFTGIWTVSMGTALTVLMVFAKRFLIQAFIDDTEVIEYGMQMVVALQLSCPFVGILFLCVNTIQGMGKALPSLILTICRQGLIFIPLIYILDHIFGLNGVIHAQAASDYLSIGVAVCICLSIFQSMDREAAKREKAAQHTEM